jgi:hypothetical protein
MKHTKLPWELDRYRIWSLERDRDYIAECKFTANERAHKNGEFIIKACNNHYKLLNACRELLAWCIEPDKKYIYESLINSIEEK